MAGSEAVNGLRSENHVPVSDSAIRQPDQAESPQSESERNEPVEATIAIGNGDYLDDQAAAAIARTRRSQLIVLAGGEGSGKTTLLASLYELFQQGPFAGYWFAGSSTLPGFERRCHLARIASLREAPDTERTRSTESNTLLHLAVKRIGSFDAPRDLLFTDLAGERFRLARDSTEECRKLDILLRADYFVVLVDGAKLAEPGDRQAALVDAHSIVRSCLDAGMLDQTSFVDVLFAKWDLIHQGRLSDVRRFVNQAQERLMAELNSRVGRLRLFNVAARPERGSLTFGFGLKRCFPSWVDEFPRRPAPFSELTPDLSQMREIDRVMHG
jgi:hypothetical protein